MASLIRKRSRFAAVFDRAAAFCSSEDMIPFLGAFVVLCHACGFDLLGFTVLAGVCVFVFCSDAPIRGCVPPLLLACYVVSVQNGVSQPNAPLDPLFYRTHAGYLAFLAVTVIWSAIYGIRKRRLKPRFTFLTATAAALGAAILSGGGFSPEYSAATPLLGAALAACFILFFLFFCTLAPELSFDYVACAVWIGSLCVLWEFFYLLLRTGAWSDGLQKPEIALGWGISNNIAPMIAVGLPFSAYGAATAKKSGVAAVFFLIAAIQTAGIALCLSRAMLLFAVPFVIGAVVFALCRQTGRRRAVLAVLACASVCAFVAYAVLWKAEFLSTFRFYVVNGLDDRGRLSLYREARDVFLARPWFGAGVAYRLNDRAFWDLPVFMVHNTVLQFMLWSGVIGLFAILLHIFCIAKLTVYKPSLRRVTLMSAALLLFFQSMFDWMWFYPFALLSYALLTATAEIIR